ncbi:calcineurin-like phosphoesterase [Zalerion maritima]|uniref:Calcineurin-like phosphoesterase n=1 Tax=Zalerion maritima TaxID=339359 RepID=A0AAD5RRF7_9PEZI|nr:calcineurin-like phosphoesterase [Zalerion maritima]
MGLLVRLGLRRSMKWEPRTLLDWVLYSPLQHIVSKVYFLLLFLRGRPFRPARNKRPIRVVCISDTHDHTSFPYPVPKGDLLIHAGDMTNSGTAEDIQKQIDWIAAQPHEHKVVVCGNHDCWFDPRVRRSVDNRPRAKRLDLSGVTWLQGEMASFEFFGGERVLNVFGKGDVPFLGEEKSPDASYEYPREKHPWNGIIPRGTDVLVTHTPPAYHLDLAGLGCRGLMKELWRVKPRLHIFGHVHWGHGRESAFFDKCQAAYEALMARPGGGPIWDICTPNWGWVYAVQVLVYGSQAVLFKWLMQGPGGGEGCLMVNAAMMHGNTGKMENRFEVVDI